MTKPIAPARYDCFPPSAKQFYWGHRQWLADMDRHALEMLAMNLLLKREADGINGRTWDAHQHLFFESLVAHALPRLPNIACQTDGGNITSTTK